MGLKNSKLKDTLLPVETPMSQEECNRLERIFDKNQMESFQQYTVIEKYLTEDLKQYKKDLCAYREKQGSYVITDRELLERGEALMLRHIIQWDGGVNCRWVSL